ncbi:hypothetical protein ACHNHQ_004254 [Salmonella enterica]|uniref:hypothetical protein n=1 Tax=Salmonella enterica TaxID=28901 RepID=UPI002F42F488
MSITPYVRLILWIEVNFMKLYWVLFGLSLVSFGTLAGHHLSDSQVKKEIIKESIEGYPGVCACPYNHTRNGSSCGRRSAYSRNGGFDTVCYPSDVSKKMIKEWRSVHEG